MCTTLFLVLPYAVFCEPAVEHWTSQEARFCATATNRSLEPPSFYFTLHSCKLLQHVKCTGGEIISTYGVALGVQLLFESCVGRYRANRDDRVNIKDWEILNTSEWLRKIKYNQKLFHSGAGEGGRNASRKLCILIMGSTVRTTNL
jgi:hypothetical protein